MKFAKKISVFCNRSEEEIIGNVTYTQKIKRKRDRIVFSLDPFVTIVKRGKIPEKCNLCGRQELLIKSFIKGKDICEACRKRLRQTKKCPVCGDYRGLVDNDKYCIQCCVNSIKLGRHLEKG